MTIRVSGELKHKIERVADEQGVSINQLALYALTKEIMEMETFSFFNSITRSKRKKAILDDFDAVMAKIRPSKVPEWDKM